MMTMLTIQRELRCVGRSDERAKCSDPSASVFTAADVDDVDDVGDVDDDVSEQKKTMMIQRELNVGSDERAKWLDPSAFVFTGRQMVTIMRGIFMMMILTEFNINR